MKRDVIIACDFASAEATYAFLDRFTEEKPFVKIGMELYYAEGPAIVREIRRRGHSVFLDLKLHDIPNTVEKAMMEAALRGLTREDGTRPILLAVTQLTSTSEERMHDELLISGSIADCVCHYALMAKEAGLDGVVCSPLEAGMVKERCGKEFLTVTPGIRFADGVAGDQVRITTPARAKETGSDFIVVGRPITAAEDPVAAYRQSVKEFRE